MTIKSKLLLCIAGVALAVSMLIVGVIAATSQTITMQGIVNIDVPDRTLYLKDMQVQYDGEGQAEPISGFRKGYVGKEFCLQGSVQVSGNTKILLDIVNLVIDGHTCEYNVVTSWSGGAVSNVNFDVRESAKSIAAGTVAPEGFTSDTLVSGRVVIEIVSTQSTTFDLSNIKVEVVDATKIYLPNADFEIGSDGESISIGGIGSASGDVVIPERVSVVGDGLVEGDDFTVTEIANNAFAYNDDITSVTLPDSVTSIGGSAFSNCSNLTTVNLPEGLTEIGTSTFISCDSLTTIVLPDTLKTIGQYAFQDCKGLTNIVLPDGLTTISQYAFYNCQSLTDTLNIPASVTEIGPGALILQGLTAFTVDDDNQYFSAEDGILYNKDKTRLITYPRAKVSTDLVIRNTVEIIDAYAFYQVPNIRGTLTLPDGLTTIGSYAFYNCDQLSGAINISASVTEIGSGTFTGCQFTAFNVDENNGVYASENGVLYNKDKTVLRLYPSAKPDTSFVVPDGVTTIFSEAFRSNTKLNSVTLPTGLTNIQSFAFYWCTNLEGEMAIPSTVTSIADTAFSGCTKLTAINIDNGHYTSVDGVLYNADKSRLINYPAGKTDASFVIPNTVEEIAQYSFYCAIHISSITIPASVQEIGAFAFDGLVNLTTATIDSTAVAATLQDTSYLYLGGALKYATTLYILDSAADSLPDRFFTMFSETSSDKTGYKKFAAI